VNVVFIAGVGALLLTLASCTPPAAKLDSNEETLDLANLNAVTLQQQLASGDLSAAELTGAYLARINTIDAAGPTLRAILEVNPDAEQIARELDIHFQNHGPIGPLHGLPVVLKANVDTGDRLATSAGSQALAQHIASADAFLVSRLRDAGAVILGKANMSEWANLRSTSSSSGWSSLGGQVRNPYVLDRNPCGSSSGSAVAVAASLAALAVGTETDGSIVCPAGLSGVVGIKPTVGTVSRTGIIPVAHSQDTAGPMAKTVTGAALLLQAMVAHDENDSGSIELPDSASLLPDPAETSLAGTRVGVWRTYPGADKHPRVEAVYARSIEVLRSLGAQIVEPIDLVPDEAIGNAEYQVLLSEFKADLNAYLQSHNIAEDRDTLEELIAYNVRNKDTVMPIFGQEIFHAAQATTGLADPAYLEALAGSGERVREALIAVFSRHNLDALIAPTNAPAWKTDWVGGDHFSVGSSGLAAISGYPSITVPAGYVSGLPIGVSFVGLALGEASLIQIAYAFEQATLARVEPTFIPTLER
jgi:amidase